MPKHDSIPNKRAKKQTLQNVLEFRFPYLYKRYSFLLAMASIAFLIIYKIVGGDDIFIKDILRSLLVLFLFVTTLSQEKEEDEYIRHLRSQSYIISSVLAVAYSIGIPLLVSFFNLIRSYWGLEETLKFEKISAFEVLFMLVSFQLLFFSVLKRQSNG